jgi:hypothetical protein
MAADSASVPYNLPQPSQAEVDAAREREIESARLSMVACDAKGDKEGAREYQEQMYALITDRSEEQRARMEAKLPKKWGTR